MTISRGGPVNGRCMAIVNGHCESSISWTDVSLHHESWGTRYRALVASDPPEGPSQDEVFEAVDALLEVFDRAAALTPELHARVEAARQRNTAGVSAPEAIDAIRHHQPLLITATNGLLDDLVNVGARLRRLVAQSLYANGMTMAEIASVFGVSRQRVSTLIRSDATETHAPWTRSGGDAPDL